MANCSDCGGTIKYVNRSLGKCEYCGKLYDDKGNIADSTYLDMLYRNADDLARGDADGISKAISIFEELGSYSDSYIKVQLCQDSLRRLRVEEEEKRLESERKNAIEKIAREKEEYKQKQIRKFKMYGIIAISTIIVVSLVVIISVNSSRKKNYQAALEYYEKGQYEEALQRFTKLKGYSDAGDKKSEIEKFLKNRDDAYSKGVSYYETGLYNEAIESLNYCIDFQDAKEYIEKSSDQLLVQANSAFEAKEYSKAIEICQGIPEDSINHAKAIKLCNDAKIEVTKIENENDYELAIKAYNEGNIDEAQILFKKIKNYKDSETYLSEIGTTFYNNAQECYKQKDWDGCGNYLLKIDESSEWSQFSEAKDLYTSIKEEYVNAIIPEAKKICRSEGDNAKDSYIDSMVCSLLTREEVGQLKSECTIASMWLTELEPMDKYGVIKTGTINESLVTGEECVNGFMPSSWSYGDSYLEYYLEGKYSTISGLWGPIMGAYTSSKSSFFFKIYADDVLVYTSPSIHKGDLSVPIEANINNCQKLKVMFNMGEDDVALINVKLFE